MQFRDKFALSVAGLTGKGQRGIFAAMCLTLAIASGAWCVVYGLLTGAERVSQHRIDAKPFPYRLLLGRQYTTIKPADLTEVTQRINRIGNNSLKQMFSFRVCDWNVGMVMDDDKSEFNENTKGRTIATDQHGKVDGEFHPMIHGLGLVVDRTDQFEDGIFLCPRVLGFLGITLDQVPERVALDLKKGAKEATVANVLGVLKHDPPERVYFLCPEPFADSLLTRPATIRFSPLNGRMLDQFKQDLREEKARELEQLLKVQEDIESADMDELFRFVTIRGRGRSVQEWSQKVKSVVTELEFSESDFEKTEFASSEPLPYNMVELYFESGSSLPKVVNEIDELPCFEGEVDRTVADLVTQLESFSAARVAVLGLMRWALAGICVLCLSVVQIMRCLQRKDQAAMLRIMGMSNWQLINIAFLDGLLVWFAGLSLGLLPAILVLGPQFASAQFPDPVEAKIAFVFTLNDSTCLGAFSLLFTEMSACLAAYFGWLRKHPADMF